jgi:hypothetical protein
MVVEPDPAAGLMPLVESSCDLAKSFDSYRTCANRDGAYRREAVVAALHAPLTRGFAQL